MNVLRFDHDGPWLDTLASLWGERLRQNPRLKLCLPSGHTPTPLYRRMAELTRTGKVSFRAAEVFALDEFGDLPASDPGRCANMLRRDLLDHVDLPPKNFHAFDTGAADLERVCRDYDHAVGDGFDLCLLGLGLNGHLGLNEPGSERDCPTRRVDLHATTVQSSAKYLTHASLPTWGVTAGMRQLLAAKEVWLLVNGPAKAAITGQLLEGSISAAVPASWLRLHTNSWLFAAALDQRDQP